MDENIVVDGWTPELLVKAVDDAQDNDFEFTLYGKRCRVAR